MAEVSSGQSDVTESEVELKLGHSPAVSQTGLRTGSGFKHTDTVIRSTFCFLKV